MRLALTAGAALLAAGCAATGPQVVTDLQVIERPVPVPCEIRWPQKPAPYVAQVQLTGRPATDLVLIWRAAEAEIEARRAYEAQLEAALLACAGT